MTREEVIEELLSADIDTVQQWAIQGCRDELYNFLREMLGYDQLSEDDLIEQAMGRGIECGDDND